MAMGDVIRYARENKEMTQAVLADKVGTTTRTIIAIEKGKRNPTHDVLSRIINVLDISADSIFCQDAKPLSVEQDQFVHEFTSCDERRQRVIMAAVRAMIKEWDKDNTVDGN